MLAALLSQVGAQFQQKLIALYSNVFVVVKTFCYLRCRLTKY